MNEENKNIKSGNNPIIIGGGPSGLIMGAFLRYKNSCKDYKIFNKDNHNFKDEELYGIKFSKGQRTLFDDGWIKFFAEHILGVPPMGVVDLSHLMSIRFKGRFYSYPIQFAKDLPLMMKLRMYWDYIWRDKKLLKNNNYANYVEGTYGKFLARNIILPHTWKTMKEDLWMVDPTGYGKKVIPLKLFGKNKPVNKILDDDAKSFFQYLRSLSENYIFNRAVQEIRIQNKTIIADNTPHNYDRLFSTMPLPFMLDLINDKPPIVDAAHKSLCYNDMLAVTLIVPINFIKVNKEIIYFPERDFIFSKVNIVRNDKYAAITSEISFRMNERKKLECSAFIEKIYNRVENDLKHSDIIPHNLFTSMEYRNYTISPAYIICDHETEMYNNIIQSWLEQNDIFTIGRFAQWKPEMRIEHSIMRAKQLMEKFYGL